MYIYTLELENGCYYVGTTNNPAARLAEHRGGNGAEWTRKHAPIRFSQEYKLQKLNCSGTDARLQEDAQTKKVMFSEGIDKVRGGSYSRPDLTRDEIKLLCKELFHAKNGCLRCGHPSHWAKDCHAEFDVVGHKINDDVQQGINCFRCGRPNHTHDQCYASKDVNGYPIYDEEESESEDEDCCFRCGRPGHWARDCYARTTIEGHRL